MKRLYIITVLVALLSVSCNDWLDVRPDTEQKDKDLFTTYKGFQDALSGTSSVIRHATRITTS